MRYHTMLCYNSVHATFIAVAVSIFTAVAVAAAIAMYLMYVLMAGSTSKAAGGRRTKIAFTKF